MRQLLLDHWYLSCCQCSCSLQNPPRPPLLLSLPSHSHWELQYRASQRENGDSSREAQPCLEALEPFEGGEWIVCSCPQESLWLLSHSCVCARAVPARCEGAGLRVSHCTSCPWLLDPQAQVYGLTAGSGSWKTAGSSQEKLLFQLGSG